MNILFVHSTTLIQEPVTGKARYLALSRMQFLEDNVGAILRAKCYARLRDWKIGNISKRR